MITQFELTHISLIPEDGRDQMWIFEYIKRLVGDGDISTNNIECYAHDGCVNTSSQCLTNVFKSQEYKDYVDNKLDEEYKDNYEIWLDDMMRGIKVLDIYNHEL